MEVGTSLCSPVSGVAVFAFWRIVAFVEHNSQICLKVDDETRMIAKRSEGTRHGRMIVRGAIDRSITASSGYKLTGTGYRGVSSHEK
eukprot:1281223-Prymnesium_polylepis.1